MGSQGGPKTGDVQLSRGDQDFLTVGDASGGDQVSPDHVATTTGRENPLGISLETVLSGDGEPPMPMDPMRGHADGCEGCERVARLEGANGSGGMCCRALSPMIPVRPSGRSRRDPAAGGDSKAAVLASSPGGGRPNGCLPLYPALLLRVVRVSIGVILGAVKHVEADRAGNGVTRGSPLHRSRAVERTVQKDNVLTESEIARRRNTVGEMKQRDVGHIRKGENPGERHRRAPHTEVLRSCFAAPAEWAGGEGRGAKSPLPARKSRRGGGAAPDGAGDGSNIGVSEGPACGNPRGGAPGRPGKTRLTPCHPPVVVRGRGPGQGNGGRAAGEAQPGAIPSHGGPPAPRKATERPEEKTDRVEPRREAPSVT